MERAEKHTLYLLGGSKRAGKSTIMREVIKQMPIPLMKVGSLVEGLRNMLTGDSSWKKLGQINLQASGVYPSWKGEIQWERSQQTNEQELCDALMNGVIRHYSRNQVNLAMEGSQITPEWVKTINLKYHFVRAAFVGYTDPIHIESILEHARKTESDWIRWRLCPENGGEIGLRKWVQQEAESNKLLSDRANSLGYPFFDLTSQPFDQYTKAVQDYFLEPIP